MDDFIKIEWVNEYIERVLMKQNGIFNLPDKRMLISCTLYM